MKVLLLATLLLSGSVFANNENGAFEKPKEPAASKMYEHARELAEAGQVDAVLLFDTLNIGWSSAHPNLPIQPYVACMLYQFDGIDAFVDLHYAELRKVLAGDDTLADGGQAAAYAYVAKMTPTQKHMAERLKFFMKKYAATCSAALTGQLGPDDLGPAPVI